MPIDVPSTTVYARLSTSSSIPVEAAKIQGAVIQSNASSSITFPQLRSDVSGITYLSFVAGHGAGVCWEGGMGVLMFVRMHVEPLYMHVD